MPTPPPPLGDAATAQLEAIGQQLRARRLRLRVSATAAAEAAGLSRVTLHRIERGAAAVSMGAYLNAAAALGLELMAVDPQAPTSPDPTAQVEDRLPSAVRLADFAQLRRLSWQLQDVTELTPREALNLYERNWRHVDVNHMDDRERSLVHALARELGGGRLLV